MFKKILESYKGFDKITCKILKSGLLFCLSLAIVSIAILLTYNLNGHSPLLYNIGMILFKLSLIFGIEFVICSFVSDGIKKQLI